MDSDDDEPKPISDDDDLEQTSTQLKEKKS